MKKIIRLSLLTLVQFYFISAKAQLPILTWRLDFGGVNEEIAGNDRSVCALSNGGWVWAGASGSSNGDIPGNNSAEDEGTCSGLLRDIYIVKFDSEGDTVWTKNHGGSANDRAFAIRQTADGKYIVVGSSSSNDQDVSDNNGGSDMWILKLGTGGNISWEVNFGGSGDDRAFAVDIAPGGYIVAGRTESSDGDAVGSDGNDLWVMKISDSGTMIWQMFFDSGGSDFQTSIEATTDGGYIVVNSKTILKLNSSGNEQWRYESDKNFNSVTETPDGGFAVVGDMGIEKRNSAGIVEWNINYHPEEVAPNTNGTYHLNSIINSQSGGYLVAGHYEVSYFGLSSSDEQGFILRVNDAGVVEWHCPVNQLGEKLRSLVELEDGAIIVGGTVINTDVFYAVEYGKYSENGYVARYEEPNIYMSQPDIFTFELSLCEGDTVVINRSIFNPNFQPYQIQLSDANGDFSNPTPLQQISYTFPYEFVIPSGIPTGTGYRVRPVSLANGMVGDDNGDDITITAFLNPKFSENMGSVISNTTIAAHEAANGFHQDGYTMSGTGTVSNDDPSSGYENATGDANIYLGSTGSNTFIISGINTVANDIQYLRFGVYSPGFLIPAVVVAVSTDGVNYTDLDFSPPFSSGWDSETTTGDIPQAANLRIRFTRFAAGGSNVRIDDVKLIHDPENVHITTSGPPEFCGPGSVTLIVPGATSYLWSNGATTQTTNVSTTGDYSCILGSGNGCDFKTQPIHIQTTATTYYADEDADGYGDDNNSMLLCAPDDIYTTSIAGDCDDQNAEIHPGAIELCDEIDSDCSGSPYLSGTLDYDLDNDGYSICNGDCNDYDNDINPGEVDIENGLDDNCDGETDNYYLGTPLYRDLDGDMYGDLHQPWLTNIPQVGYVNNYLDCDDSDPVVYASALEVCGDGKDNNCDGIVDNCACLGDLDGNGMVNVSDLLLFTSAFGSSCD